MKAELKSAQVNPKVISLVNLRGGVGRTTLAIAIASCLAEFHRQRVLLVDLDPLGGTSKELKSREITQGASPIRRIAVTQSISFDLTSFIEPRDSGQYDIVLIDTPATLCSSLWSGLSLSTHYLTPTIPKAVPTSEIVCLFQTIQQFSHRINREIKPLGIVVTHVREGEMLEEFRREMLFEGDANLRGMPPVFKHFIRHIHDLSKNGPDSADMRDVVKELLQRL